jgi:hypothetical protein
MLFRITVIVTIALYASFWVPSEAIIAWSVLAGFVIAMAFVVRNIILNVAWVARNRRVAPIRRPTFDRS